MCPPATGPDAPPTAAPAGGPPAAPPAGGAMPALTLEELFERLGWFVSIRWFAGLAALLLVLIGWYGFGVRIEPRPVVLTVAVLFGYNALFLLLVTDAYRRQRVSPRFVSGCANAQIVCDLITLAVLMHLTGGVENPFIVFFICPLVIASELLPNRIAYAHALLGAVLINLVAWLEYAGVLPHVAVGRAVGSETYRNPLFIVKFSVALTFLAFAIVFLGGSIAARLRRRESELEAAHEQLRELEKSKSFLMRQTSHDLRAPLDALISLLRAVTECRAAAADPQLADLLRRAEQRAVGLRHLIDELHRYAVLRDVVGTLTRQRLDLAELAAKCIGLYEAMATEKGLRLRQALESPAEVFGNPDALSELLGNLLANAIQYTPAGGELRVEVQRPDGGVVLTVSDTGIGIPASALPRIFDEFYRAPNAKEAFRGGTGMGLPIVRRIVETHGGRIDVESTVGRGTTFRVVLPAAD